MTNPDDIKFTPKVTVIIPAYNQVQWLGEAIDSVLAQDHPVNEIIVVDDGSPDNSAEFAASYGGVVKVISKKNAGLSAARNTGILASSGDWLIFLDSDDVLPTNFVSEHLKTTTSQNADVVFAGSQYTDVEGNTIADPVYGGMLPGEDMLTALLRGNAFPPHAAMTRRGAIENAGAFDATLTSYEDWDFWLRLAFSGATFAATAGLVVPYRQHPASMSKNAKRMYLNGMIVIEKLRSSDRLVNRLAKCDKRTLKNAEWGIRYHYFKVLLQEAVCRQSVFSRFFALLRLITRACLRQESLILISPFRLWIRTSLRQLKICFLRSDAKF